MLNRIVAFFLCFTLLISSGQGNSFEPPPQKISPPHSQPGPSFSFPQELGTIEDFHQGKSGKTILYIQDAHDSFEAQQNIAKLISHFVDKDGVKTVFEEGYEGPVPTDDYFGLVSDPGIRQKIAWFLMDKLRIGGAEYAHINRKRDFRLVGADSIKLQLQNIGWYRKNARLQNETAEDLARIRTGLEQLIDRYFPKELKGWMKLKEKLASNQLALPDYLKRTAQLRPELLKNFPQLQSLLQMESLSAAQASKIAEGINAKTLFREMESFEESVAGSFLKEERDRKIFQYYRSLELLNRLNRIELTPAEYDAAQEIIAETNTQELVRFIARESGKSLVLSKAWERNIRNAVRFYEWAEARNKVIEKRLSAFLNNPYEQTAVLVFGGFHKQGVSQILEKLGVSYAVISPKIQALDPEHQEDYKKLMSVGRYAFEVPSPVRTASRAESRLIQWNRSGADAARNELRVMEDVVRQSVSSDPAVWEKEMERRLAQMHQPRRSETETAPLSPGSRAFHDLFTMWKIFDSQKEPSENIHFENLNKKLERESGFIRLPLKGYGQLDLQANLPEAWLKDPLFGRVNQVFPEVYWDQLGHSVGAGAKSPGFWFIRRIQHPRYKAGYEVVMADRGDGFADEDGDGQPDIMRFVYPGQGSRKLRGDRLGFSLSVQAADEFEVITNGWRWVKGVQPFLNVGGMRDTPQHPRNQWVGSTRKLQKFDSPNGNLMIFRVWENFPGFETSSIPSDELYAWILGMKPVFRAEARLLPGHVLKGENGQFRILQYFEETAISTLYTALDLRNNQEILVKTLNFPEGTSVSMDLMKRRHAHEVEGLKIWSEGKNPYSPEFLDAGSDPERRLFWIAMEKIDGVPLTEWRLSHYSTQEALDIFERILEGFQVLHDRGILHRDIKPNNILVTPDGRIKILDLGLSEINGVPFPVEHIGQISGHPNYVPLEAGITPLKPSADIFSLGVLLFELATGDPFIEMHRTFSSYEPPENEIKNHLPSDWKIFAPLIFKALSRDAQKRPQSAAQMLADFRWIRDGGFWGNAAQYFKYLSPWMGGRSESRNLKQQDRTMEREKLMKLLEKRLLHLEQNEYQLTPEAREKIMQAFRAVDRAGFVQNPITAYWNESLPIGEWGERISQPETVAEMLVLAAPYLGRKTLEIGSGSGYASALLSFLSAEVYGVEVSEKQARRSRERLDGLGILHVHFLPADGNFGWIEKAPYDLILISAEPESLAFLKFILQPQLAEGGAVVFPYRGNLYRYVKKRGRLVEDRVIKGHYLFVPLQRGRTPLWQNIVDGLRWLVAYFAKIFNLGIPFFLQREELWGKEKWKFEIEKKSAAFLARYPQTGPEALKAIYRLQRDVAVNMRMSFGLVARVDEARLEMPNALLLLALGRTEKDLKQSVALKHFFGEDLSGLGPFAFSLFPAVTPKQPLPVTDPQRLFYEDLVGLFKKAFEAKQQLELAGALEEAGNEFLARAETRTTLTAFEGENLTGNILKGERGETYEILSLVQSTGTSFIYLARENGSGQAAMVKVSKLPPLVGLSLETVKRRHAHEIAATKLWADKNPFSPAFMDSGADSEKNLFWIAQEFIEGETLEEWLQSAVRGRNEILDRFDQILQGFQEMHNRRILHHDIKPNNILILPDETKIIDLGESKIGTTPVPAESTGLVLGNPNYISPENGSDSYNEASEIFSLGVVLFKMATGSPYFRKSEFFYVLFPTEARLREHLKDEWKPFAPVIAKALERNPKHRYQSVMEMREALRALRTDEEEPSTFWILNWAKKFKRSESRQNHQIVDERNTIQKHYYIEAAYLLSRSGFLNGLRVRFIKGAKRYSPARIFEWTDQEFARRKEKLRLNVIELRKEEKWTGVPYFRQDEWQRLFDLLETLDVPLEDPEIKGRKLEGWPIGISSPGLYSLYGLPEMTGNFSNLAWRKPVEKEFFERWRDILPQDLRFGIFYSAEEWTRFLVSENISEWAAGLAMSEPEYMIYALRYTMTPRVLLHEFIHIMQFFAQSTEPVFDVFLQMAEEHFPELAHRLSAWEKSLLQFYDKREVHWEFGALFYDHFFSRETDIGWRVVSWNSPERNWAEDVGAHLRKLDTEHPDLDGIFQTLGRIYDFLQTLIAEGKAAGLLSYMRSYYLRLHPLIPLPKFIHRIAGADDGFDFPERLWPTSRNFRLGEEMALQFLPGLTFSQDVTRSILDPQDEVPGFAWNYKENGISTRRLFRSAGGLKGFLDGFERIKKSGIAGQWSLAFHAENQEGQGDFRFYFDALLSQRPDEFKPVRAELNRIFQQVPADAGLSEKIARDLKAAGFMSAFYDRLSRERAEARNSPSDSGVEIKNLAGLLGQIHSVVDVGTGRGEWMEALTKSPPAWLAPGASVTGLEQKEPAHYPEYGLRVDAETIWNEKGLRVLREPFGDDYPSEESIDLLHAAFVRQNSSLDWLDQYSRLVRPGGWILISHADFLLRRREFLDWFTKNNYSFVVFDRTTGFPPDYPESFWWKWAFSKLSLASLPSQSYGNYIIVAQKPARSESRTSEPSGTRRAEARAERSDEVLLAKAVSTDKIAEIAKRMGLDLRPVHYRLLNALYVAHDMAVHRLVNPGHTLQRGRYRAAGADISNFLLSTDLPAADFEALYHGVTTRDLEEALHNRVFGERFNAYRSSYLYWKSRAGYARGEGLGSKQEFLFALRIELEAMGIDPRRVRIFADSRGVPTIEFSWNYPGRLPRLYQISFIDVLGDEKERKKLTTGPYDVLYQRAALDLPYGYDNAEFAEILKSVRLGGYFVTDDYAVRNFKFENRSGFFPGAYPVLPVPVVPEIRNAIYGVRVFLTPERKPAGNHYGWDVTVRRNEEVAAPVIDQAPQKSELRASSAEIEQPLRDALKAEFRDWEQDPDVQIKRMALYSQTPFHVLVSFDADNDVTGLAFGKEGYENSPHAFMVEQGGKEVSVFVSGEGIGIEIFSDASHARLLSRFVLREVSGRNFLHVLVQNGEPLRQSVTIEFSDWEKKTGLPENGSGIRSEWRSLDAWKKAIALFTFRLRNGRATSQDPFVEAARREPSIARFVDNALTYPADRTEKAVAGEEHSKVTAGFVEEKEEQFWPFNIACATKNILMQWLTPEQKASRKNLAFHPPGKPPVPSADPARHQKRLTKLTEALTLIYEEDHGGAAPPSGRSLEETLLFEGEGFLSVDLPTLSMSFDPVEQKMSFYHVDPERRMIMFSWPFLDSPKVDARLLALEIRQARQTMLLLKALKDVPPEEFDRWSVFARDYLNLAEGIAARENAFYESHIAALLEEDELRRDSVDVQQRGLQGQVEKLESLLGLRPNTKMSSDLLRDNVKMLGAFYDLRDLYNRLVMLQERLGANWKDNALRYYMRLFDAIVTIQRADFGRLPGTIQEDKVFMYLWLGSAYHDKFLLALESLLIGPFQDTQKSDVRYPRFLKAEEKSILFSSAIEPSSEVLEIKYLSVLRNRMRRAPADKRAEYQRVIDRVIFLFQQNAKRVLVRKGFESLFASSFGKPKPFPYAPELRADVTNLDSGDTVLVIHPRDVSPEEPGLELHLSYLNGHFQVQPRNYKNLPAGGLLRRVLPQIMSDVRLWVEAMTPQLGSDITLETVSLESIPFEIRMEEIEAETARQKEHIEKFLQRIRMSGWFQFGDSLSTEGARLKTYTAADDKKRYTIEAQGGQLRLKTEEIQLMNLGAVTPWVLSAEGLLNPQGWLAELKYHNVFQEIFTSLQNFLREEFPLLMNRQAARNRESARAVAAFIQQQIQSILMKATDGTSPGRREVSDSGKKTAEIIYSFTHDSKDYTVTKVDGAYHFPIFLNGESITTRVILTAEGLTTPEQMRFLTVADQEPFRKLYRDLEGFFEGFHTPLVDEHMEAVAKKAQSPSLALLERLNAFLEQDWTGASGYSKKIETVRKDHYPEAWSSVTYTFTVGDQNHSIYFSNGTYQMSLFNPQTSRTESFKLTERGISETEWSNDLSDALQESFRQMFLRLDKFFRQDFDRLMQAEQERKAGEAGIASERFQRSLREMIGLVEGGRNFQVSTGRGEVPEIISYRFQNGDYHYSLFRSGEILELETIVGEEAQKIRLTPKGIEGPDWVQHLPEGGQQPFIGLREDLIAALQSKIPNWARDVQLWIDRLTTFLDDAIDRTADHPDIEEALIGPVDAARQAMMKNEPDHAWQSLQEALQAWSETWNWPQGREVLTNTAVFLRPFVVDHRAEARQVRGVLHGVALQDAGRAEARAGGAVQPHFRILRTLQRSSKENKRVVVAESETAGKRVLKIQGLETPADEPVDELRAFYRGRHEHEVRILSYLNEEAKGRISPIFYKAHEDRPGNRLLIEMEYLEGAQNLNVWAAGKTLNEKLKVFRNLVAKVWELHTLGIIHRDLTFKNILVLPDGEVRIVDYAASQLWDELPPDYHHRFVPDPRYGSPDMPDFGTVVTEKEDVYALGVILFYLLARDMAAAKQVFPSFADFFREYDRMPGESDLFYLMSPETKPYLAIIFKAISMDEADRKYGTAQMFMDLRALAPKPKWVYTPGRKYKISRRKDRQEIRRVEKTARAELRSAFNLERILDQNEGGGKVVYLASEKNAPEKKLILKIQGMDGFDDEAVEFFRQKHEHEVRILKALQGSALATAAFQKAMFDSVNRLFIIVMDYLEDTQDLLSWARNKPVETRLDVFDEVLVQAGVMHGLGVVHRDLSHTNIRVNEQNKPFILDFGGSQLKGNFPPVYSTWQTNSTYAPPEMLDFGAKVEPNADLYALGAQLYQLLAADLDKARKAFPGGFLHFYWRNSRMPNEQEIRAQLKPGMEGFARIIVKAISADRTQRYQSAEEFRVDLRRERAEARRSPRPSRPGRDQVRSLLKTYKNTGTLLIRRAELRSLNEKQWETFFIAANEGAQLKTIVYGDSETSDDGRMRQVRASRNFIVTRSELREALKSFAVPNRKALVLTKDGIDVSALGLKAELLKRVRLVKLGEEESGVYLALLYAISDGHLPFVRESKDGYLEDPRSYYANVIAEHLRDQVVGWSA